MPVGLDEPARRAATTAALPPYIAALWEIAPRLSALPPSSAEADVPPRPVLSGETPEQRSLHLPWHTAWGGDLLWQQAAASHAAAHWRYGGTPMSREGLKPVQQALVGVLEDARVEWCAMQELPGLRSLWLPFHEGAGAAEGNGFEALLGRLARSLLNPAYEDRHPWVAKARAVFFRTGAPTPALDSVHAVRHAASLLGNDIGQMRLPFNARTYRAHAAYRDDNSQLWLPDAKAAESDTPLDGGDAAAQSIAAGADGHSPPAEQFSIHSEDSAQAIGTEAVAVYPEWDHVIQRYRAHWCHVHAAPPEVSSMPALRTFAADQGVAHALQRLRGGVAQSSQRALHGDALHLDAAIDWYADLRHQRTPEQRVYRRMLRPALPMAVLLLMDASASTARPAEGPADATMLDAICQASSAASMGLQTLGHRTAVHAFSSNGRQRIDMPCLQGWGEKAGSCIVDSRIAALRSGGSTRLGAVVRHAAALSLLDARRAPGWRRAVVLVTDGEPHDIDIHDPAYLLADLKKAVHQAMGRGLHIGFLVLPPGRPEAIARVLGTGGCTQLQDAAALPKRLLTLLQNMQ